MPTVKQNLSLELERAWVFQALSCFSSLATGSGLHRVWRKVGTRRSGSWNSLGFTWLLYPTFFRAFYSLTKSSQVLPTFGPGQFLGFGFFYCKLFIRPGPFESGLPPVPALVVFGRMKRKGKTGTCRQLFAEEGRTSFPAEAHRGHRLPAPDPDFRSAEAKVVGSSPGNATRCL